jgi:plasmid maintenance system killer protein
MPKLIPSRKFLEDAGALRLNPVLTKKLAKTLRLLEANPLHPGLHLERIVNDPTAWSVRIDQRYRLSFDPESNLPAGNPDFSASLIILRVLDHDDLYRHPR